MPPIGKVIEKTKIVNPSKEYKNTFTYIDISAVSENKEIKARVLSIGEAPSRARKLVKSGDTIFATTRPYLRNIRLIPRVLHGAIASTGFCVIRPLKEIADSKYIYYFVSSDYFVEKVLPFQKGATYPAVSDSAIYNQTIPLPPLAEQKKIVARIDAMTQKVRELQALQAETAADLVTLKQSILHKAFQGKL